MKNRIPFPIFAKNMRVSVVRLFEKDIAKVDSDSILIWKVLEFISKLEACESLSEITGIKKLQWYEKYYRYRIGEFRLGFHIENETVTLDRFLHRKDIYRRYP